MTDPWPRQPKPTWVLWLIIPLAVVCVVGLVAMMLTPTPKPKAASPPLPSSASTTPPVSTPPPPSTPAPSTPAPTKTASLTEQVDTAVKNVLPNARLDLERSKDHRWFVILDIRDAMSKKRVRENADVDVRKALGAIHETDPEAEMILVRGYFPYIDGQGKTISKMVLTYIFDDALKRLPWPDLLSLNLEQWADHTYIHADLRYV